jgi:hypothetical protein
VQIVISDSAAALTKNGDVYFWTRSVKPVKVFSEVMLPNASSAVKDKATCISQAVKWKGKTNSLQGRRDLIQNLLDVMQQKNLTNVQEQAYVLATADWETGGFNWLVENNEPAVLNKNYGPGTLEGGHLGNTQSDDGYRYRGRGLVHVTGRRHYAEWSQLLNQDFIDNPDLMADPAIAAQVAVQGMIEGRFTSRSKNLGTYLGKDGKFDYLGARAIINGRSNDLVTKNDPHSLSIKQFIANQARQIEAALQKCGG